MRPLVFATLCGTAIVLDGSPGDAALAHGLVMDCPDLSPDWQPLVFPVGGATSVHSAAPPDSAPNCYVMEYGKFQAIF